MDQVQIEMCSVGDGEVKCSGLKIYYKGFGEFDLSHGDEGGK